MCCFAFYSIFSYIFFKTCDIFIRLRSVYVSLIFLRQTFLVLVQYILFRHGGIATDDETSSLLEVVDILSTLKVNSQIDLNTQAAFSWIFGSSWEQAFTACVDFPTSGWLSTIVLAGYSEAGNSLHVLNSEHLARRVLVFDTDPVLVQRNMNTQLQASLKFRSILELTLICEYFSVF